MQPGYEGRCGGQLSTAQAIQELQDEVGYRSQPPEHQVVEEFQRCVVPEADPPFHWYLLEPDLDRFGQVCKVPIEMRRSV